MLTVGPLNVSWLEVEIGFRAVLAFLLGALPGLERERARRPAGLRTHMLVAGGSAAFTLASLYGFAGPGASPDLSRVAAGIVTGVGFLGAGTILRGDTRVVGLTTAASIWTVASVGMLVGVGMYGLAVLVTVLTFAVLRLSHDRGEEGRPG